MLNFNFREGMFEVFLPKGLGLLTTYLEIDADLHTSSPFFSNGSSNNRKQAQLPPNVRSLKYKKRGVFPEAATLPE